MKGLNRKELLKEIGEDNWDSWCEFIMGHTVGVGTNGETLYYENDVKMFKSKLYRERGQNTP